LSVQVVVVSDTRTLDTDTGGKACVDVLSAAGHVVRERVIVRDDVLAIRATLKQVLQEPAADAVVFTGGTGIAPRDVTPEALMPLLEQELPGFGETFRRLSYEQIGVAALFSRAFAGFIGETLVVAVPGSQAACELAMQALVIPMLPHALGLRRH
jgi:molybdenum cofactor biosynthesis protein B